MPQIEESQTTRRIRLFGKLSILMAALASLSACTAEPNATTTTEEAVTGDPVRIVYEFQDGSDGWASDISDFSEETTPEDLLSQTGVTPPGIEEESGYFHLAASNRSDDLFMFMSKQIGTDAALAANTAYSIEFTVAAASNAPSDCAGIGGAPGESVWLKVGASTEQPIPVAKDGYTRLTVDKGVQSQGGEDADIAGVIANGIPCEEALDSDQPYAMVTWNHTLQRTVETNGEGELWAFIGTDSGFEGRTSLYYDTVELDIEPQN
jgi:hypothetical protein